jgi:hypothetical protein
MSDVIFVTGWTEWKNKEAEYRLCIPQNYYILRTLHDCHISISESRKLKIDAVIQKIYNLFQKSLIKFNFVNCFHCGS